MIDCILKFTSKAAALTALANHTDGQDWLPDHVLPDVKVWRTSQDVGDVHTYLTGYFVMISLPQAVPALNNIAAVQFVVDRDLANAWQPGMILKANLTNAVLQDLRVSPLFAGCDWPFGAWL
jgi:hypothetical protein